MSLNSHFPGFSTVDYVPLSIGRVSGDCPMTVSVMVMVIVILFSGIGILESLPFALPLSLAPTLLFCTAGVWDRPDCLSWRGGGLSPPLLLLLFVIVPLKAFCS